MKIYKNDKLEMLAEAAGRSADEVSTILVAELVSAGIVPDGSEAFATTIESHWMDWFCEKTVEEVVGILRKVGIRVVTCHHINALLGLRFMGEGDCPVCGGVMEVMDAKQVCVSGDGYNSPREYETLWEDLCCPHCGHVRSTGYHPDED